MGEEVARLVRDALDHMISVDRRREAESFLQRSARTPEGLQWALKSIELHEQQALQDPQVLFFAASILEGAAGPHHWQKLTNAEKSDLKRCLWQASLSPKPSMPSFVTSKLVSAMATLACTDYESAYWTELVKICQNGPGRQQALRLLDASIDRIRYVAHSGITGQQGMVLYSELPMLQTRLKEAHSVALNALTALVQRLVSDTSPYYLPESDVVILQAFRALQNVIGGLAAAPPQDNDDISLIVTHSVAFCLFRLEKSAPSEADCTLATAAMACIEELLPRPRSKPATLRMIHAMLCSLHPTCEKWAERRRLFRTGSVAALGDEEGDRLAVIGLVRLLCQVLQQMDRIATHKPLLTQVLSALEAAVNVLIAAGRPGDVLLLAELWHPLLSHLDNLEEHEWLIERSGGSDEGHGHPYRKGITSTLSLMLNTFFSEQAPQAPQMPPYFHASQLSDEPGSGAELTELLAGVSFSEELEATIAETVAERKRGEEWEERKGSHSQAATWPSEREVYARHIELFFSHAVSTYASILAPLGLEHLRESMRAAGEAGAMLARGELTAETAPAYRFAFHSLKFSLGIARSCVPLNHFQWKEADTTANNEGNEGALDVATSNGSALAKLQLLQTLLQFGKDWIVTTQYIVQNLGGIPPEGHEMYFTVTAFLGLADDIFKTITALLNRVMPAAVEGGTDIAREILIASLDLINDAVVLSCAIAFQPNCSGAASELADAAATCLHSLTAMNLFLLVHTPLDTLKAACSSSSFTSLHALAVLGITKQGAMPTSALRLLWSGLSDLVLRVWATPLQSKKASIEENTAAYTGLMLPLVQQMEVGRAAAPGGLDEQTLGRAVSTAAAVIETFTGSPKVIREISFSTFVRPMLFGTAELLRSGTASAHPRVLPPLLRVMASSLRTFSAELGTSGIGELLGELMPAFCNSVQYSGTAIDPECTAELAFLDLVAESLSFGAGKHHSLVPPALEFGLKTLERVGQGGACHVKAQILCSLCSILCNNWRYVVPPPLHEGQSAAPLPAPVTAVFSKVATFFSDVAEERSMPSTDDIRTVLEELYELHVVSKIYWRPDFAPLRESLLHSLLAVLLSRMFTGAQTQVIDAIYGLAAANWSSFLLEIFPAFIQMRMAELGARGPELASIHFGVTDPKGAGNFESSLLAFVNDATYWKRCL